MAGIGLTLAGAPALDCAQPGQARAQIARLCLAEIEYAEDVHRHAHWKEMGHCPQGATGDRCRNVVSRRFEAAWEARRAEIEAKYRQMSEDYDAGCRASITLRAAPGRQAHEP